MSFPALLICCIALVGVLTVIWIYLLLATSPWHRARVDEWRAAGLSMGLLLCAPLAAMIAWPYLWCSNEFELRWREDTEEYA